MSSTALTLLAIFAIIWIGAIHQAARALMILRSGAPELCDRVFTRRRSGTKDQGVGAARRVL